MPKLKFTLSNIFLWVGFFVSCVLLENTSFLTSHQSDPLSDSLFYLLFAIGLTSFAAVYIFEHIFNKIKIDLGLIIPISLLFVAGTLAIWLYKPVYWVSGDPLTFTIGENIRNTISFLMFCIVLYSILFIYTKNLVTYRNMKWLYILTIVMGLAAVGYSFIFEAAQYKQLFMGNPESARFKSFFWNGNMFAATVYFATIAAIILNLSKKNVFSYIAIAIFALQEMMTISALSIISEFFLLFFYFLIEIILAFKRHPKRSGILLAVFIIFSTTIASVLIFGKGWDNLFGKLSSRLYSELFGNTNIDSNRHYTWEEMMKFQFSSPLTALFGTGFGVSSEIIKVITMKTPTGYYVASAHNGVIQILFNYGIVGLSVYVAYAVYFVICFIKMMKWKRPRFALLTSMIGLSLLGYSIGESIIMFNSNAQGIIIGALFYLPLVIEVKHRLHPEIKEGIIKDTKVEIKPLKQEDLIKTISIVCLLLFCVALPFAFVPSIQRDQNLFYIVLGIIVSLFVLYLLLPYVVSLWFKSVKPRKLVGRLILNISIIVLSIAGIAVGCYFLKDVIPFAYLAFLPLVVAVVLLIELLIFSIKNGGSIKLYFVTIKALYQNCLYAVIFTALIPILFLSFFGSAFEFSLLFTVIFVVMNVTLFLIGYFASNLGNNWDLIMYFNQIELKHRAKQVLKNEGIN